MGQPRNRLTHLDELADVQKSVSEPITRANGDALEDDDLWLDLSVSPRVWRTYDSSVPGYVAMGGSGGAATTALTIEAGHVDTGGTVLWRWGIDAATGQPYFDDTDGADVGEEATVTVDSGRFYIEEIAL